MKLSDKIANAIKDEEEAIRVYKEIESDLLKEQMERPIHLSLRGERIIAKETLRIITSIRRDEERHKSHLEILYKALTNFGW